MSRQNMAPKHQFRARNASNKALVWDVLFAFFSLGITAALLGFTPTLGELECEQAFGLEGSDVVIENPVFPAQTDNEADQPISFGNANDIVNETPTDVTANTPANKTDSENNKQPGSADNTGDESSDKLLSDSADNASSNETADDATHESTDKVTSGASDTSTNKDSDKAENDSENNSGTPDSSLKDTLSTEANNAASDKSNETDNSDASNDSNTPSTTVTVDSLPGLGPEAPLYTDGFATRSNDDAEQEYAVTFSPNGGGGSAVTRTTTTGNITLPSIAELGFTPPDGALFVGWSPSSSGFNPVYASDVMYPDNAEHTAVLQGDTTLYAIWLKPGSAEDRDTAYYFIRMDGKIPFEPSGYSSSAYIPSGTNPGLVGELNWGISVTNNLEAVAANLYSQPTDEEIQAAMERQGQTFDPETQEVVWYVIKVRAHKAWNVDGIIVNKADYLVQYNPNGGDSSVPVAQAYKSGATVAVSFAPTPGRPGYTFLGWDEDPSATTPTYTASGTTSFTMPNSQVTLYAIWEKSTVKLTYVAESTEAGQVSRDSDEVYAIDGVPVDDGSLQGSTATASTGYLFQGWYKKDNTGNDVLVTTDETLSEETAIRNANYHQGILLPTVYVARFVKVAPAFTLTKTVQNEPANGQFFAAGESITYEVTVTNTGNVPLETITFKDNLAEVPTIDALAVGESKTVTYTYVVTAEDVKADVLTNTVEATATTPDLPGETVTTDPATTSTFVGTLLPDQTYVLFAAYPSTEGNVDRTYNIVNNATGEGIEENTAVATGDYEFDGWYKEGDDTLITKSPTLTADEIKENMNRGKGRTPYGPTLFVAHFTPKATTPDTPDNPGGGSGSGGSGGTTTPDTPDTPDVPDKPTNPDTPTPDTPDMPDTPDQPDKPSNPGDSGSGDSGNTGGSGSGTTTNPTTPNKPNEPSKPDNSGTTSGGSSGPSGSTNGPSSDNNSSVQTPSNELGPSGSNSGNMSPTTPEGTTPTDVPASSIKAENVDSNTKLAQTDDFALKVILPTLLGIAGLSAVALFGMWLYRKHKK